MRTGRLVALLALGVLLPGVAYGAATLPRPSLDATDGPVTFAPGDDFATARRAGLVGDYVGGPKDGSYLLPLHGLAGGSAVIDDLLRITPREGTSMYGLRVAAALTPTVTRPTELSVRLWTLESVPCSLDVALAAGVTVEACAAAGGPHECARLDLLSPTGTASDGSCTQATRVQLVMAFPSEAHGEGLVALEPTGVR